jgi:broad specificity phosphatase PhoE
VRLAALHRGETIGVVSHGDVIKAALAKVLGLSLDNLESFEIAPGSVSVLALSDGASCVKSINLLSGRSCG